MDVNDLRSLATVLCFIALAGIFYWAYDPKRKSRFEADAQLLFGDEVNTDRSSNRSSSNKNSSNNSNNKQDGGAVNE